MQENMHINFMNSKKSIGGRRRCMVIKGSYLSLSPILHNAGYQAVGIQDDFEYAELTLAPDQLDNTMKDLRNPNKFWRGVSVGNPFKNKIGGVMAENSDGSLKYLDEIDKSAQEIGSVNTIVIDTKNGKPYLTGTNTDWIGFSIALNEKIKNIREQNIAIVG